MSSNPPIGPYELVRRLGVGGMAETFEAKRSLGPISTQRVCIKRVLPAYANDPSYVALFQREARLATRLRHPNIVAVLDAGEDGEHGDPYLVLELVDGIDLRALLATAPHRRLGPEVTSYLAMELAYALAYAHAESEDRPAIVHRDLSPSNVLLSRGGDVKLADFGLAKPVHGHDVTQSGSMRGKIPYLPPEQMRGEHVDARADLFALGVVLYECLAGRRPFDGAHEVETMTRILSDRRDPIAVAAPDTPPALADLVERLLAHDRRGRPESALAVVHALDALPPPIRARLRLLDLVETRLGGSDSRRHVRVDRHGGRLAPARQLAPIAETETETETEAEAEAEAEAETEAEAEAGSGTGTGTGTGTGRPPRAAWFWGALGAFVVVVSGIWVGLDTGAEREGSGRPSPIITTPTAPNADRSPGFPAGRRPGTPARPAQSSRSTPPAPVVTTRGDVNEAALAARATPHAPLDVTTPAEGGDAGVQTAAVVPARPERAEGRTGAGTTTASVRVVVHPWGLVWVDGRALGRAPRVLALGPGTHRIEVGQDGPRTSRSVHVAAGDRRFLQFDLAEASGGP